LTFCPAYNVEPITSTSSSSCANNDGRRGVLDARRRLLWLCFSQFATRTVDDTVDLYAAKPDMRPELHFFAYPICIQRSGPLEGFPSEYCHTVWYGKTRMVWLPDGKKISKISLFVLAQFTNVSDGQTDRQTDKHRMTT